MAQPDVRSNSHIVIDIDIDGEPTTSHCAVCLEPSVWVAVGRCGHYDVCARCASRMRFFHGDRRCCICRRHCPIVVVTTAERARKEALSFPKPPPESGSGNSFWYHRDVGYWYHHGMGAYFDDLPQYIVMRMACEKPPNTQGVRESLDRWYLFIAAAIRTYSIAAAPPPCPPATASLPPVRLHRPLPSGNVELPPPSYGPPTILQPPAAANVSADEQERGRPSVTRCLPLARAMNRFAVWRRPPYSNRKRRGEC